MTRDATHEAAVTAVVVAGGRSTRFGADKLAASIDGTTVLDSLLDSLPASWPVVVVGAPRSTTRAVRWTREEPPDGGPLAAIEAGLALVTTRLVAVVAGDMPLAAPAVQALVEVLSTAPDEVGAVIATDAEDVANPLLAAYRAAAVREALPHPAHGRPARTLLQVPHVTVPVRDRASRDVDTPADLTALERLE